jgi:hypothetical protein
MLLPRLSGTTAYGSGRPGDYSRAKMACNAIGGRGRRAGCGGLGPIIGDSSNSSLRRQRRRAMVLETAKMLNLDGSLHQLAALARYEGLHQVVVPLM